MDFKALYNMEFVGLIVILAFLIMDYNNRTITFLNVMPFSHAIKHVLKHHLEPYLVKNNFKIIHPIKLNQ